MPRRRKLHILRFAFRGKSSVAPLCPEEIPLGDSSSPHQTHFVGLWRGPCPKAALWILAFYTGAWRGDVRTLLRVRPGAINAI